LTRSDNPDERLTAYQAISRMKKDQGMKFDPKAMRALMSRCQAPTTCPTSANKRCKQRKCAIVKSAWLT
ncbi:hypothetical protein, partial [Candidatus Aquicultor secundus]